MSPPKNRVHTYKPRSYPQHSNKSVQKIVDDSHVLFEIREQSSQFLDILNRQDPSIQYSRVPNNKRGWNKDVLGGKKSKN